MENRYISNKNVNAAEKRAIGYVFTTLALILTDSESLIPVGIKKWLKNESGLCGSLEENNYRRFLTQILKLKQNDHATYGRLTSHPYLAPCIRLLDIEKPSSRFEKFATDLRAPETFNMQEYLGLICKLDGNGKIIGLNENVLLGDESQKHEVGDALNGLFDNIASIELEPKEFSKQ